MEDDIRVEQESRHGAHKDRVAAVDIDHQLRQGPSSVGATANSAPNAPCIVAYKPNEAFLQRGGSKSFPWYKISETCVRSEDARPFLIICYLEDLSQIFRCQ